LEQQKKLANKKQENQLEPTSLSIMDDSKKFANYETNKIGTYITKLKYLRLVNVAFQSINASKFAIEGLSETQHQIKEFGILCNFVRTKWLRFRYLER
jgi:hypothetical protein